MQSQLASVGLAQIKVVFSIKKVKLKILCKQVTLASENLPVQEATVAGCNLRAMLPCYFMHTWLKNL